MYKRICIIKQAKMLANGRLSAKLLDRCTEKYGHLQFLISDHPSGSSRNSSSSNNNGKHAKTKI